MVNLSIVEKFYIESHRDLKPHRISKRMRKAITEQVVDEYLKTLPPPEKEAPKVSGDLMNRDGKKGVAVMTPAASEMSDTFRDEASESTPDNNDRIHRIK